MAIEPQVMAAEALVFVDWLSRESDQMATGRLAGQKVTITGPSASVGEVNVNQEARFTPAGVFTPPLPTSDAVELRSTPNAREFKVEFENAVQDIVLHLASLGSVLTFFEQGTTVTKVSSDERLTLEGTTVVKGQQFTGPPSDGNGTLLVRKPTPFTSVRFRVNTAPGAIAPDEGIHLQIGRSLR